MKVTFKDVGQGDSIILEWQDKGQNKVGIIDCNLKGNRNPVLVHIHKSGYKEIDFLILSHPHRDHYSGLSSLFKYVEKNKIIIRRFGHTLIYIGNRFWKYSEVGSEDKRLLSKALRQIKHLREVGLIERQMNLSVGYPVEIAGNIKLMCLAPSEDDGFKFQKLVEYNADINDKDASEAANFLSTVFLLNVDGQYSLLTSDAEIFTLEGIKQRDSDLFTGIKMQLCQLPHHGSIKNFHPLFWELIETDETKHAIVSAGEHKTYNHPSYEVLEAFHKKGYQIHCTNILNGMKEFTDYLETITERSLGLAPAGLAEEYKKSSDRVFEIKDGGITLF